MPKKRAWLLHDSLNQGVGSPVIDTASGGRGGGTSLTPLGEQLLRRYLALEDSINAAAGAELAALRALAD